MHIGLILIFQADLESGYICAPLMCTSKGLLVSPGNTQRIHPHIPGRSFECSETTVVVINVAIQFFLDFLSVLMTSCIVDLKLFSTITLALTFCIILKKYVPLIPKIKLITISE
jgi:hypothetical protein